LARIIFGVIPVARTSFGDYAVYLVMNSTSFAARFSAHERFADCHDGYFLF